MGTSMIRYVARSDKGCVRKNNEDNIFFCGQYLTGRQLLSPFSVEGECSLPAIFGVFDGVGGEEYGECASMIAAQTLADYEPQIISALEGELGSQMCSFGESVNQRIKKMSLINGFRMGTTAAIVVISKDVIRAYNIGDSRIYMYAHGKLKQISVDDTLARLRIDGKEYTAQEARRSRDWGKLTACLGISGIDGKLAGLTHSPIVPVNKMVRLLLCSDGITDMVPDNIIETVLRIRLPNQAGKRLMSEALNRGGVDNASFVIIDVVPESPLINRWKNLIHFRG